MPSLRHASRALLAVALAALVVGAMAQGRTPIPSPTVRVNDNARLLGEPQAAAVDQLLYDYERDEGKKILLLTVASTGGEPIEDYAARVGKSWRLGSDATTGDIVIVIARDNRSDQRSVRIEVAPALRGRLSEATLARVVDEDIVPRFQSLDYEGGIRAGVERLESLLDGAAFPAAATPSEVGSASGTSRRVTFAIAAAVAGFVALLALAAVFVRKTARRMFYLTGDRALHRAHPAMLAGRAVGKAPVSEEAADEFGTVAIERRAGGRVEFGGGGSSAQW